jgi:hypothetical protein
MTHAIMWATCIELLSLGSSVKGIKGVFCRVVDETISVVASMQGCKWVSYSIFISTNYLH